MRVAEVGGLGKKIGVRADVVVRDFAAEDHGQPRGGDVVGELAAVGTGDRLAAVVSEHVRQAVRSVFSASSAL
ncbi:hypothetical protein ACIF83_18925 [Streptomyces sp. NPDC085866]|uniref:hypothetical protein n=1 Tax=Streptomyces sp. NPDC085866 TaxID=3365736 RepID=UPI0037D613A4